MPADTQLPDEHTPQRNYPHYKLGRPTNFRAELCQDVVAFCSNGYSLTAFAGKIGVCFETICDWRDTYPLFSEACKRAKAASTECWEDRARHAAMRGASGGQVAMIIFMLKNHAPEEFRDRIEHTGKDGAPLALEVLLGKVEEESLQSQAVKTIEHEAAVDGT